MGKKQQTSDNLKEGKESLLNLVKDIHCFDQLNYYVQANNVFEILKISRTEIRHSNMLAWLLDPNESHGLKDALLYNFIAILSENNQIENDLILRLLASDLNCVKIYREWEHIDLLLVFPKAKAVIAIENKIGSDEHNSNGSDVSQLKTYTEKINKVYKDYSRIKIFLTPSGDDASEDDWITFTYEALVSEMEEVYDLSKNNLGVVEQIMISHYIDIIKKRVVMDNELIAICNEIYQKHKKALDLIFENRDDTTKMVSDLLKSSLTTISKDGNNELGIDIDDSSSKAYIKFWTSKLKENFRSLDNINYYYQIEIRPKEGSTTAVIKLVFHQDKKTPLEKEWIGEMNKFISKNKLEQGSSWEWKTAWTSGVETFEEVDETEISNWLKDKINAIKDMESRIPNASDRSHL